MQKITALLSLTLVLALSACANTTPVRRLSVAAVMPRTIALLSTEQDPETKIKGRAGYNRGVAWKDNGEVKASSMAVFGPAIEMDNWSAGWNIFAGRALTSADDTGNWGSQFHFAYRFKKDQWRIIPQALYGISINHVEERGCKNATFSLFGSGCENGQPTSRSRAEIKVLEPGIAVAIQRMMGDSFWAVAPAVYYTNISASNALEVDAAHDIVIGSKRVNYSLLVLYGGSKHNLWSIGGGIASTASFEADGAHRQWDPIADLRVQF